MDFGKLLLSNSRYAIVSGISQEILQDPVMKCSYNNVKEGI